MNISIIDDSELALHVHHFILKTHFKNCEITKHKCPETFIDMLSQGMIKVPDLVFTDYNMGKHNGVELLSKVEKVKKELQIGDDKLNFVMVSSEANLMQIFNTCKSPLLKGYFHKPLKHSNVEGLMISLSPKPQKFHITSHNLNLIYSII
ncbi:response regulator [Psychroflexus aestuariivivens]|uniref:response regulator n=1 Tax=Psychroflexus aestuariivivens TaxID=1795040 RepID=UPI000FD7AB60|nr:response regulator [Psychroflexus aestuariivivens]